MLNLEPGQKKTQEEHLADLDEFVQWIKGFYGGYVGISVLQAVEYMQYLWSEVPEELVEDTIMPILRVMTKDT